MFLCARSVFIVVGVVASGAMAEQWNFEGSFLRVEPGQGAVAVFQLPDGVTLKIPVAALTQASRREIARLATVDMTAIAGDSSDGRVMVRLPSGKTTALPVPPALRDVETEAFLCRTADDAAAAYRRFLERGDLAPEDREAATRRLTHWESYSKEGRVRFGDEWLNRTERHDRETRAAEMVEHAVELLRLGNGSLAREELREASRLNPENGTADFLAGLLYTLVGGNDSKGIEHFQEVVRREPKNAFALNNLAVCEVMNKQSHLALGHFRQALEIMPEAQAVADNLGGMIQVAGSGRLRISAKNLAECNALYRQALTKNGLQPLSADRKEGFTLLGGDGTVWDRTTAVALVRPGETPDPSNAESAAPSLPAATPTDPAGGQQLPGLGGIDFQAVIEAARAAFPTSQQEGTNAPGGPP